ncbi:hypothetical protein G6F59_017880 [Rhizopus arrhizus]|nr:hypothetical protein G6F59_017880 [Rhizopus arrhizus]
MPVSASAPTRVTTTAASRISSRTPRWPTWSSACATGAQWRRRQHRQGAGVPAGARSGLSPAGGGVLARPAVQLRRTRRFRTCRTDPQRRCAKHDRRLQRR